MTELSLEEYLKLTTEQKAKYDAEWKAKLVKEAEAILLSPTSEFRKKQQRATSLPYYRPDCAEEILPIFDWIIQNRKGKDFRHSDYKFWKPQTLYARIQQSYQYIQDHMDKDGRYKGLKPMIEIQRLPKSVRIEWIANVKEKLIARDIKDEATYEDVFEAIKEHIEIGPVNVKFILPDDNFLPFELTAEEITKLQEFCDKLQGAGILAMIGDKQVTIIKTESAGGLSH